MTKPPLPKGLLRLRNVALGVFILQLVIMLWWSHRISTRFSLTDDFGQYGQAWWAIAHGHLNPHDSISLAPFWHDHSVLLMWPLALITHFYLDGFTPLAVQDALLVAAEAIAFFWLLRELRDHDLGMRLPNWGVGAISLVLLTCNPWIYWGASFDVHFDATLPAPLLVLSLRALYYRKYRQLVLWSALILLCGDLAVTYLAAVGLTGLLIGLVQRERRRTAISFGVMVAGIAGFVLITHVGGNAGSFNLLNSAAHNTSFANVPGGADHAAHPPSAVGNLITVLLHPWRLVFAPFHHLHNVWALLSPAGPLGVLSPWGLPLAGLIAVENTAAGSYFSTIAFQYAPAWAPAVVGGVLVARPLARYAWGRKLVTALLVASLVNTVGWAIVWTPRVSQQWVRVDSAAADVLSQARSMIPADAEVIVSEGVVGGFAGRSDLHAFPGNQGNLQPIDADEIYFVVVPYKGIQLATVNQSLGLLGALVGHIHAKLVLYGHGVWVFRLVPSPAQVRQGVIDVTATYDDTAIPVWGAHSAVGHPVLTGPPKDWAMTASSHSDGYILYGAYFRKPLGNYVMQVSMTSNGPANVEAWNATSQTLLGRRIVPGTSQRTTVEVPVPNIHAYPQPLFRGHGPFTLNPIPPPDYQTVETRIWIPAGTTATVHSVRFIRRDS